MSRDVWDIFHLNLGRFPAAYKPVQREIVEPDRVRIMNIRRVGTRASDFGALGRWSKPILTTATVFLSLFGLLQCERRALSSAGERCLHTAEVTGSIPVAPTMPLWRTSSCRRSTLLAGWSYLIISTDLLIGSPRLRS